MPTIEQVTAAIDAAPQWIREECDAKIAAWQESEDAGDHDDGETYTDADALRDVIDGDASPAARRDLLRIQIALGVYAPIDESEMRSRIANGIGVKASYFPKLDGRRYEFKEWTF